MKWLVRILIAIVVIGAGMAGIGWMLPVQHTASRSGEVAGSPDDVYAVVSNVRDYPAWWSDIEKVEMLADEPGRTVFREHMSTGPVVMSVAEAVPGSRFVTKIDDPDQPFGGTWTFELQPAGQGRTRVTLTERGEVYNPVFRFLSRFVFGHAATIEACLAALQVRRW